MLFVSFLFYGLGCRYCLFNGQSLFRWDMEEIIMLNIWLRRLFWNHYPRIFSLHYFLIINLIKYQFILLKEVNLNDKLDITFLYLSNFLNMMDETNDDMVFPLLILLIIFLILHLHLPLMMLNILHIHPIYIIYIFTISSYILIVRIYLYYLGKKHFGINDLGPNLN